MPEFTASLECDFFTYEVKAYIDEDTVNTLEIYFGDEPLTNKQRIHFINVYGETDLDDEIRNQYDAWAKDHDEEGIGHIKLPDYLRNCNVYIPSDAPESSIYYIIMEPRTMPSFEFPDGLPPLIDVCGILVHGQEVSEPIYNLLSKHDWETEIIAHLKSRATDDLVDKAIESLEIRQLEGRSA